MSKDALMDAVRDWTARGHPDKLIRVFKFGGEWCLPGCVNETCSSDIVCMVPRSVRLAHISAPKPDGRIHPACGTRFKVAGGVIVDCELPAAHAGLCWHGSSFEPSRD